MYMQAAGDPGQAFCNCILVCLLDNTVKSKLFVKCLGETFQGENAAHDERARLVGSGRHQRYTEEATVSLGYSDRYPSLHETRLKCVARDDTSN